MSLNILGVWSQPKAGLGDDWQSLWKDLGFTLEFCRPSGEGMGLAVHASSQHLVRENLMVSLQHSKPRFPHPDVGVDLQHLGHSTFRVLCSCGAMGDARLNVSSARFLEGQQGNKALTIPVLSHSLPTAAVDRAESKQVWSTGHARLVARRAAQSPDSVPKPLHCRRLRSAGHVLLPTRSLACGVGGWDKEPWPVWPGPLGGCLDILGH